MGTGSSKHRKNVFIFLVSVYVITYYTKYLNIVVIDTETF